jgi:hypothetical protein
MKIDSGLGEDARREPLDVLIVNSGIHPISIFQSTPLVARIFSTCSRSTPSVR